MLDAKGTGIGPIEALVAQLSLGFGAITWVLTGMGSFGGVEEVAIVPLLGLSWVGARVRERQKRDAVDGASDSEVRDAIEEGSA